MVRGVAYLLALAIFVAIIVHSPLATSGPGANPKDPAKEDLTRVDFPSQRTLPWVGHFIHPNETLESLYGADWPLVARFNRVDRRHVYPGMSIKVPVNLADLRGYSPLPRDYEPARRHEKYILIDRSEQWLGAYEFGRLAFSMPAATGKAGTETPAGLFRVSARHRTHTSSLYETDDRTAQYPMDYAIRFHVGADGAAYWIHARDLPGRPASHGCVGLYDEPMQKRTYGIPEQPLLHDSKRLYDWAVGEAAYGEDTGELEELEEGPYVEVIGELPSYRIEDLVRN